MAGTERERESGGGPGRPVGGGAAGEGRTSRRGQLSALLPRPRSGLAWGALGPQARESQAKAGTLQMWSWELGKGSSAPSPLAQLEWETPPPIPGIQLSRNGSLWVLCFLRARGISAPPDWSGDGRGARCGQGYMPGVVWKGAGSWAVSLATWLKRMQRWRRQAGAAGVPGNLARFQGAQLA